MPLPSWLLPLIMGGGSLLSGLFGNRAASNAADKDRDLQREIFEWQKEQAARAAAQSEQFGWWDRWRSTWDTLVEASYHQDTSMKGGSEGSATPFIKDSYAGIEDAAKGIIENRLRQGSPLPPGFAQQGIKGINQGFDQVNQAISSVLAQKGLASSPAGAAGIRQYEGARASDIGNFLANMPLQERALQNEDLEIARAFLDAFGKGMHTVSSQWSETNTSGGSRSYTKYIPTDPNNVGVPGGAPPKVPNVPGPGGTPPPEDGVGGHSNYVWHPGMRNPPPGSINDLLAYLFGQGSVRA